MRSAKKIITQLWISVTQIRIFITRLWISVT